MSTQASMVKLTPREREVVYFLGHGFSYKEIAQKMNVGLYTIRKDISSSMKKLEARNSCHVVKILCEHGFFSV